MEDRLFEREPFDRRSAWCWLIEHAMFADTKHLHRGQLQVTVRGLAAAWRWEPAKVQRYLSAMQKAEMIECIADTHGTTITLCNYSKYQALLCIGDTVSDTHPIQTRYTPDTPYKEGKKEESESPNGLSRASNGASHEIETEFFAKFWPRYPRKTARGDALKAFKAARKIAGLDEILAGLERYRTEVEGTAEQYIKLPAGWLRSQRWLDQPSLLTASTFGAPGFG